MSTKFNKEALCGEWVHSSEEDTDDEIVFRPSSYDFPLRRQPRDVYELQPDGKFVKGTATAADSVKQAQGEWELAEENEIAFRTESEPDRKLQIASVEDDKLVLKK
ncbi:MAG TPA: hypothetical protein VF596_00325 [Pyrinomonadaceae bacterium]|jgi:hypothetical protein